MKRIVCHGEIIYNLKDKYGANLQYIVRTPKMQLNIYGEKIEKTKLVIDEETTVGEKT